MKLLSYLWLLLLPTYHFYLTPIFHSTVMSSVHFSSVAQSCLTLCDTMNRSTPGLPLYHQLPEFTQTPVHQVSDAIQPSHPLSSRVFSNESTLRGRWPEYWSFSFNIIPSLFNNLSWSIYWQKIKILFYDYWFYQSNGRDYFIL